MADSKTIVNKALSYVGTFDGGNNNVIFNTDYYGTAVSGAAYPWCCAFVWDIFRMCGASGLFYDGQKTAYCPTVLNWGRQKGLTVGKNEGKNGDLVLFDWNGDGIADHIGFIISKNADGSYLTVEGNTSDSNYSNGGYVLRRTRYISQIIGIVRPKYDSSESKKSDGEAVKKTVPDVYYQVYTDKSGWLPAVKNREDYAGVDGEKIKGLRIYVKDADFVLSTHQLKGGEIDKVTLSSGSHKFRYRVRVLGSKSYLSYMENTKDTGGSTDTYAGIVGKPIDRIEICCVG